MRNTLIALLGIVLVAGIATGETIRTEQDFRDEVRFHQATSVEPGASLDIESGASLKIAGTSVGATADELNLLDKSAVGTSEVLTMGYTATAITTDTVLTDGGSYILDVTTLDVTVTLPDANTVLGESVRISVDGVTTSHAVNTDGTDTFVCGDGGASDNKAVLDAAGDAVWLQAVGADTWQCLMQNSVSSWTTQ